MEDYALYLHIPFCKHRCAYCDFNTYAGIESLIPNYIQSICIELAFLAASAPQPIKVRSIYFGGGTPSLLPVEEIERILREVGNYYLVPGNVEITLEANPGSLSELYLKELKHAGINRLSIGMQTSVPIELDVLERRHSFLDVIQAVKFARWAGINNINLDLLFAIPYQSIKSWKLSLKRAIALAPEHLSLYSLTLEHGTPMWRWVERGLIPETKTDLDAEMYEWAGEYLFSEGYHQYEISNWARETEGEGVKSCIHNLQYWRNKPYLGFGAGAHGFASNTRVKNILSPLMYTRRLLGTHSSSREADQYIFPRSSATIQAQKINKTTEMGETMMMGLRLTEEGVSEREFERRFQLSLYDVFGTEIDRLTSLGLLEWTGDRSPCIRLTSRGRMLGNQVFMEFV